MAKNDFIITISEEQANYLQRLGSEVDSKVFIIDRLFANHAQDEDTQLFDSIPYKHYMKEFEQAHLAWEIAKTEFEKTVLLPAVKEKTGEDNPIFSWMIDDFVARECKITMA